MRRIVVLVVLLLMMLGITALKSEQVRAYDPMTLAAIGFVLLAAFTVSEVGNLLRLPRVTGYILTGVVLGPSAANILSSEVVGEMKMFNTLALGLIATGAGLELDLGQLRKIWKTLFVTVGSKIILTGSLVVAALLGMQAALGTLELSSQAQVIALALVLGALSIATSPAITLAVINELKAKGRLSDLTLGAAVIKDLVVVVLLAVAVAVSRTLLAPGAALDASVIIRVSQELGSSMIAGAVLGVLLILYVRYVHAEMLLFVAAMILVVSELGRAFHLELLLVFIIAGFVVRNFSRHEHELASPLSLVSLPVFVVFFTNAGASVDLLTTWQILPLALALCAARALAFYVSARVGGAVGDESARIRRHAWLAYLPQAGVTLGLVSVASQQLPELAGPIASTGMAVVALNLLIGPVTLRRALRLTGEIPGLQAAGDKTEASAKAATALPEAPPQPAEQEASDRTREASSLIEAMEQQELRFMAKRTHVRMSEVADEFVRDELEPWLEAFQNSASEAMSGGPAPEDGPLRSWLDKDPDSETKARGASCLRLYETLHAVIPLLPEQHVVVLEARHQSVQKGDPFRLRLTKRLRTLGRSVTFRAAPIRHLPVRLAARVTLEPPLSSACADLLSAWCAFEAVMLEHISAFSSGTSSKEAVEEAMQRESTDWLRRVRAALGEQVSDAAASFARTLSNVGSPNLPSGSLRYSGVESKVRQALRKLIEEPAAWAPKLKAAQSAPILSSYLTQIDEATQQAVEQHVLARTTSAMLGMMPPIVKAREHLASVRASLESNAKKPLSELVATCQAAYPEEAELQVERAGSRLRPSASVHNVAVALRQLVSSLPEQVRVIDPDVVLRKVRGAREVTTRTVRLQDLATQQMLRLFLPHLDECVQNASSVLARANARVREAIGVALSVLEASEEAKEQGAADTEEILSALHEAEERLVALEEKIRATTDELRERASVCVHASFEAMHEAATGKSAASFAPSSPQQGSARALQRLGESISPVRFALVRARRAVREALLRLHRSELSRDIQLRFENPILDAAEIQSYTERWRSQLLVPDTYARLFDEQPVREHRRFTANQGALSTLLTAEQAWLDGGPSSALIVGNHGSGKTSLLNLSELEMRAPRLTRLRRSRTPRSVGLVAALATDLGCQPRIPHLVNTLRQTRTLVLIDDLEHWLTPDATGFRDLERLLNLVIQTRQDAFWLATIGTEALGLLEEAVAVRQAFGNVVTLHPLKLDELMHAIEGKHQLSGCSVTYPRSLLSGVLGRLRGSSDRVMFFRALLSDSKGNIAQALSLWVRAATVQEDGCISVDIPRGLSAGLPFFGQMHVREVAILVQLLRFGPMPVRLIAAGLGVNRDEAERHVGFLRMAGLIEPVEGHQDELRIPRALRAPVIEGLCSVGARS